MLNENSEQLLTESDAAETLKFTRNTLRKWRREGRGPRYKRLGRAIRYRLRDLLTWAERFDVKPESGK